MREYSNKLLDLVNNIRLLGHEFFDLRIVEKLLVTAPEKCEATITTLENTKHLSKVTLAELLNVFQAQEQRRLLRQDNITEGALFSKSKEKFAKKKQLKNSKANEEATTSDSKPKEAFIKKTYPPCHICGKLGHPPYRCWKRHAAKCIECNEMGHEAVICEYKNQLQEEKAKSVEKEEEEDSLIVAICFNEKEASEGWLVDSGCTNHMTNDRELFKNLNETNTTKCSVTCILRWATYQKNPSCPQCKHPFEFLNVHRSLDGCIHDYMFEESVCLLLRATWFIPLTVEPQKDAYEEEEDLSQYYYDENNGNDDGDEEDGRYFTSGSSSIRIGNRRWGDNGYVRAGRKEARPVNRRSTEDSEAGPSRQSKNKEALCDAPPTGRRAKRALKREAADKAAAAKHEQHLQRLGLK